MTITTAPRPPEQDELQALIAEARRRTRQRRARYAFALVSLVGVAGGLYFGLEHAGTAPRGGPAGRAAGFVPGSCPRQIQARWRPNMAHRPEGTVVPLDPLAGQLCVYKTDWGGPIPLRFSAHLTGAEARALSLLLDRRGGPGPSCDYGHPVLMRLRYPSGRVISRLAEGCAPELVWTPGGRRELSPSGTLAVGGLIEPPLTRHGRMTRVPNYVGQRLATAVRSFQRRFHAPGEGLAPYELEDPGVPFGRVVWQTPLPGSAEPAGGAGGNVIVAVHSEPLCRADQLLGRYINGQGLTAGLNLGGIELFDTSAHTCSLQGRIALHGIASGGRAATQTYSQPVRPPLVLSPRTTLTTVEHDPASALIATFSFTFSSPIGCRAPKVIQAWTVTLGNGSTLRITNRSGDRALYSCGESLSRGLTPRLAGVELLGT